MLTDLKQQGIVIKAVPNSITVALDSTSSCDSCSAKSGCLSSKLLQTSTDNTIEISIDNRFKVGDKVLVNISKAGFLKALFVVYLLPVFLALGTSLVLINHTTSNNNDLFVLLAIIISIIISAKLQQSDFFKVEKYCKLQCSPYIN